MTYIILYLVIGLVVAVVARIQSKQKQQLTGWLGVILFWPFIIMEVLGDWEI